MLGNLFDLIGILLLVAAIFKGFINVDIPAATLLVILSLGSVLLSHRARARQ